MNSIVALSVFAGLACAEIKQVIYSDFPDPAVIHTAGGYYAFATQNGQARVPVAYSADFYNWDVLDGVDALPGPYAGWMNQTEPSVWAPDVIQRVDGPYIMYFSATDSASGKHCIGTATSATVTGPYAIAANTLACPVDQGGAIDPVGFTDEDGTYYVVYKVDGNSINSDSTPIMIQKLLPDAVTPVGDPVQLIDRDEVDGPLVEAPSLIKVDGTYYLTFSSNWYNSLAYDVSYAYGSSLSEPFTKAQYPDAPLLVSRSGDDLGSNVGTLGGPGGADFVDSGKMVFHAFMNGMNIDDGRGMFVTDIHIGDNKISLA